jgi:hypothetical protein
MKHRIPGLALVSLATLAILLLAARSVLAAMPPVAVPKGGVLAPPPRFNAPTPNLNLVANALGLKTKSLSILLTAVPGLAVTNPINIRVTYNSSATGSRWIQNIYDPKTGYRNFHNDPEGNRYKRHMKLDILLTEQQPGNKLVNFPFSWEFDLDPLFDVSITPLRFKLNNDCDRIGDSEIRFSWRAPDGQQGKRSFSTSKGKTTTINEFAWARQEVSASANLFWPDWAFYESDPIETGAFLEGFGTPTIKLLPGAGGYVGRTIKSWHGQSCYADTAFDITIRVRQYLNL